MSEQSRPLKVFLCHARSDKAIVKALYDRLVRDGVDAWLDTEKLIPGQNWEIVIPDAVRNSDVVLICLSRSSITKEGYVQKEIRFALDKALEVPEDQIFLIPARLEDCEVPRRLSSYQWVDLFTEGGYGRLMDALKRRARAINVILPAVNDQVLPQTSKPAMRASYLLAIFGLIAVILTGFFSREKLFATSENMPTQTPQPTKLATLSAVPTQATVTATASPTEISTLTPVPSATPLPLVYLDKADIKMVLVPEGAFIMGSNGFFSDELPEHQVYLSAYYIDQYEVTNAMYKKCVDDQGACDTPHIANKYNTPAYKDHPVVTVDWNMAETFCKWRGASLPTEAQWEKAARGSDSRKYPWGNGIDASYANYSASTFGKTTFVGKYGKGRSPYSAYDMAGNVWEWVADWYTEDYYSTYPDGSWPLNPKGPDFGDQRVLRGGGWAADQDDVRSALRYKADVNYNASDIGFRCARNP